MPPLESSTSPFNEYIPSEDNRVFLAKGEDVYASTAPAYDSYVHHDHAVFSQRDVMIGTNPLYDVYLQQGENGRKGFQRNGCSKFGMDWVEQYFGCMCMGSQPYSNDDSHFQDRGIHHSKVATATMKLIVYPIAKYPERLNSPLLVEKRRRSLKKHLTFQPVHRE